MNNTRQNITRKWLKCVKNGSAYRHYISWVDNNNQKQVNNETVSGEDGHQTETEEACRKFGIKLGNYRTEVEALAVLHIKYPWVKIQRRLIGTGSALLVHKDKTTVLKMLMEVKYINGKGSPIMYNGRTTITRRGNG